MKRFLVLLLVLVVSVPAFAGVKYDFTSASSGKNAVKMSGVAAIEGKSMRLDFSSGDKFMFKDSSVVISNDGGSTLYILDTKEKTYTKLNLEEMFAGLNSMMKQLGGMIKMTVENQNVTVSEAGAGEKIEGYDTKRFKTESSYDLTVAVFRMKNTSNIRTTTETWATDSLGREYTTFMHEKSFKTGMPDLDKLIDAQQNSVKGFPLKVVSTTQTTQGKKSETTTTTMTVSNIRKETIPASQFAIPSGYTETESPLAALGRQ
jgi:hypothetical protein